ncbi:hypothetical protein BST61_g5836 [Cercospora zeina]
MYETQAEILGRFKRLGHLSTAQLAQFSKDIDTLRPKNHQDNRDVRRNATRNIVEGLELTPEDAAAMVSDLMMLADASHCQRVTYRDPHPPVRGYRRPRRSQLPTTEPIVEEDGKTTEGKSSRVYHQARAETNISMSDNHQNFGPPQGPPTPDPTPSRPSVEALPQFDVSWPQPPTPAPWLKTPTHQETIDSLTLENRMLRATLTERDYEIFELELGLACSQVEAMSEREKRSRIRQRFRDLANEED